MSGEATHSENLLAKWHRRCEESQYGHYTAELVFNKLNYLLGIPVVCLSALAGTSAFASLQADTTSEVIQIATGLVSMAAAILASLQTFLRFSERAEKHRTVGARYGALKRHIEQMKAKISATEEEIDEFISNSRHQMDRLAEEAPGVSGWIFRRSRAHLKRTKEIKRS